MINDRYRAATAVTCPLMRLFVPRDLVIKPQHLRKGSCCTLDKLNYIAFTYRVQSAKVAKKMEIGPRSSSNARTFRLNLRQREALEGFLYISPWIIGFLIFTAGPMVASFFLSFTNYNIVSPPKFAGLDNYTQLLKDPLFWTSLGNTFSFTALAVPLNLIGSLGCALLLNRQFAGRSIFRTLFFLPSITPIVAVAFLWLWIFQPQIGLLNFLLSLIGIRPGPGWLTQPNWSKPALIIISLWASIGGNSMLIFLSGLQGIPAELYEAVEIDGGGTFSKFNHITIPLLSPVIFFNLILGMIAALQTFTLAYVASSGAQQGFPPGGPLYSTLFYVLNLYNNAFDYGQMGYASALGWVFFLIILALTYFQLRLSRRWVYYEAGEIV